MTNDNMSTESPFPALSSREPPTHLTPREREIVDLVTRGLTNKEIAERLAISKQTVKNYLYTMFRKFGVSTRLQLVLYTIDNRLIEKAPQKLDGGGEP